MREVVLPKSLPMINYYIKRLSIKYLFLKMSIVFFIYIYIYLIHWELFSISNKCSIHYWNFSAPKNYNDLFLSTKIMSIFPLKKRNLSFEFGEKKEPGVEKPEYKFVDKYLGGARAFSAKNQQKHDFSCIEICYWPTLELPSGWSPLMKVPISENFVL